MDDIWIQVQYVQEVVASFYIGTYYMKWVTTSWTHSRLKSWKLIIHSQVKTKNFQKEFSVLFTLIYLMSHHYPQLFDRRRSQTKKQCSLLILYFIKFTFNGFDASRTFSITEYNIIYQVPIVYKKEDEDYWSIQFQP